MSAVCRECGEKITDYRKHFTHSSFCSCVCKRCLHRIATWQEATGECWIMARESMKPEQRREVLGV